MAKKKNRPNPPKKNDSSIPYVERLAAERKEKEEGKKSEYITRTYTDEELYSHFTSSDFNHEDI